MEEKLFTKGMLEEVNGEKLFVASDGVVDRQGEVISQDGWDLSNFRKNPVVQWAHDPTEPAIATAEKLGFKTVNGSKKLVYTPVFHRKTPMSNYIADLVDAGIIKASSVGFKPNEFDQESSTYTKAELLEISFVNVPANQNALSLGMAKGYGLDVIKKVMPNADFKKLEKEKEMTEEKIEVENKGVIPYKKYPHSTSETWDASAEVKDATPEDLKQMCTWFDSEKPDIKSSYKLPHHTLSGYKTVLPACQAAMGVMMGARGGVMIPDADRRGVYNHLAKHYAEFGKEPPMMRTADEIIEKYTDSIGAEDLVVNLTRTVNDFINDFRAEIEEKKLIAEKNTELFDNNIIKRFEDIELNLQGLQEGIKPTDAGLEQRLLNVESSVEKIAKDIREYLTSQLQGKGVDGREPKMAQESKKDTGRLALKVLNKAVEAINKTYN